jgi:hypothetical protein
VYVGAEEVLILHFKIFINMGYYFAHNTGEKGFITYEENATLYIWNFLDELYITDNIEWVNKVGAQETTKEAAQEYVDALTAGQVYGPDSSDPGAPIVYVVP